MTEQMNAEARELLREFEPQWTADEFHVARAVKIITKALKAAAKEGRAEGLREALFATCPACRGVMPHSKNVVFVRGDDIYMHPGPGAADNMYPCESVGIRALMESAE